MWQTLLSHTPFLYMTQSLWRDEVFSVMVARQPLGFIIGKLGFEPPVYYTLLHFWMRLFGESELAVRSLSLLGFVLATWIVIEWAAELYKKHWLSVLLPLLFFLNPMLLYYAFEARSYAWYTFFAVTTLYAYSGKKWRLFVFAGIMGFYTHIYHLLFLAALGAHWLITAKPHRNIVRLLRHDKTARAFFFITVGALPWIIRVALALPKLTQSWYFPVDLRLVYSVLGNMFTGYEGTPWYGWKYTRYLSLLIISLIAVAVRHKAHRKQTFLYIIYGFLPLAAVVGMSFVKPLYVNRYLIPAAAMEVFLIAAAIYSVKSRLLQGLMAAGMLMLTLYINWWFPPLHPKVPFRELFTQVNAMVKSDDIVAADDALIYLETLYYTNDRSRVHLYDPKGEGIPWYIGDAVTDKARILTDYPQYPKRAFLIHPDATFDIVYRVPARTKTGTGL